MSLRSSTSLLLPSYNMYFEFSKNNKPDKTSLQSIRKTIIVTNSENMAFNNLDESEVLK